MLNNMTTIILRNGTVFDGSTNEPTIGDVTIQDGRIIADGPEADEVIDCTGKWIMPGFIDIHTHYDAEVLLGPNVAAYVGHSDLRTAVMGLSRATDGSIKPTADEMAEMEAKLHDAIDAGLLGMSGMTNPWDKVDGDRERSKSLPSTYATWREYRRLHKVLRDRGAILQSAPNLNNPLNAVFYMFTSATMGLRRALKTTLITLMDIKAKPGQDKLGLFATNLFNRMLGANFRWQALPQPFQVYADGIDFIIFEEFPAGEAALHLKQDFDRNRLFADPVYRDKFKKDYSRRWGGRCGSVILAMRGLLRVPMRTSVPTPKRRSR